MAPTIRPALSMRGFRQVGELLGEHPSTYPVPVVGQLVTPVGVLMQQSLAHQPLQVLGAHRGIDAEKTFEQGGIDPVAETLSPQPEHELENFVAPVERTQRIGLGLMQLLHDSVSS